MIRRVRNLLGLASLALVLAGCGEAENTASATVANSSSAAESDARYVAASEPQGAVPVGEARKTGQDGDEVVLVGRIGGSVKPFVDGVAVFTIVDPKVPYCAEEEGCPTPWDYCCEQNQVKDNIATIKIVDSQGVPVAKDARELLGVKELATVVVRGKAQRDDAGNLAVLADQVFVK